MNWKDKFANNPEKFKMIAMLHNLYTDKSHQISAKQELSENPDLIKKDVIKQRKKDIRNTIMSQKNIGYGGICTNVSHKKYMQDEIEWELFEYALDFCSKENMRVWIYDEDGFPSGFADGITLKNYPEGQAKGVMGIFEHISPGSTCSIPLPDNNADIVAAYAYKGETIDNIEINNPEDIKNSIKNKTLKYKNNTDNNIIAACFLMKKLYYYTNFNDEHKPEFRPYIDVTDKKATEEFIRNTYEAYKNHSSKYFGTTIEAVFTDEPSFVAPIDVNALLNSNPHNPEDEINKVGDDAIMYPIINWGIDFEEKFSNEYGYDIKLYLPYLFGGSSEKAQQVRYDFYRLHSTLYEEAFIIPISRWCQNNNIAFSGHLLFEDYLELHTAFEGDFFQLLRHMQIPGIDILIGIPEKIMEDNALTPKLVSSIARLYNREHVMSEISSYEQWVADMPVSVKQIMCSIMLQYALGVDIFCSYYPNPKWAKKAHGNDSNISNHIYPSENDFKRMNDTVARINAIMSGGKHIKKTALYYPIDTMQRHYIVNSRNATVIKRDYIKLDRALERFNKTEKSRELFRKCAASFHETIHSLLKNQIDFNVISKELLTDSNFEDGICISDKNPNEFFSSLVIPSCYIDDIMYENIITLNKNNVLVFILNDDSFPEKSNLLKPLNNVYLIDTQKDLIENIVEKTGPDILFKSKAEEIVYLYKENQNGKSILFVNYTDTRVSSSVSIRDFIDESALSDIRLYDPEKYEFTETNFKFSDNLLAFDISFDNYQSLILLSNYKGVVK